MSKIPSPFGKAGLVAGSISGIIAGVLLSLSIFISLYPSSPDRAMLLFVTFLLLYSGGFFVLGAVFGSLFGLLLKTVYKKLPFKNHFAKTYTFGFLLWFGVQLLNFPNYDLFNILFTLTLFVLIFSTILALLTRTYSHVLIKDL
ncbi:MAG: hypothetical protein ACP6IS_00100 [Candidatus Asgardarchaeia archaeon]